MLLGQAPSAAARRLLEKMRLVKAIHQGGGSGRSWPLCAHVATTLKLEARVTVRVFACSNCVENHSCTGVIKYLVCCSGCAPGADGTQTNHAAKRQHTTAVLISGARLRPGSGLSPHPPETDVAAGWRPAYRDTPATHHVAG